MSWADDFLFLRIYLVFSTLCLGGTTQLWFVARLSLLLSVSPFPWLSGAEFTILHLEISYSSKAAILSCLSAWAHWMTFSLRPHPGGARLQSFFCKGRCWQPEISSLNFSTLKMVLVLYSDWAAQVPLTVHFPPCIFHCTLSVHPGRARVPLWPGWAGTIFSACTWESLQKMLDLEIGECKESGWTWFTLI